VAYADGGAHTGPAVGGKTQAVDVGTVAGVLGVVVSAPAIMPVLYSLNQTTFLDESMTTLVGFAIVVRDGSAYSKYPVQVVPQF
jgi:hypothetical protein